MIRLLLILAVSAAAQSNLTVKTATSKHVDLSWSGTASSYNIQRAPLGGSFSTIATASGTSYSDTTVDPYTAYQYQVTAGSATSNSVSVGPPPAGFSVAAAVPPNIDPSDYGQNVAMTLDGNGDPAFAFVFYDPNQNGDPSKSQLWFRSWNRATYNWNPLVNIGVVGDATSNERATLSVGYDGTSSTFALAAEFNLSTQGIRLYVSTNGGSTWTTKNTYQNSNGNTTQSPSLVLANGNIYLGFEVDNVGVEYVTGTLSGSPQSWTTKTAPLPSFAQAPQPPVSLALDGSGNPGIVYWAGDSNSNNYYNSILIYWRPATTAAPVKVTDTQNNQRDTMAALRYFGSNPRIAFYGARNDNNADNASCCMHFVRSDDGGTTWTTPVMIPADGTASTDWPADLALDSQGNGAIAFGQNSSTGDFVCGFPKLARSPDLNGWTTCSASPVSVTLNFDPVPDSLALRNGGNDKLYMIWHDSYSSPTGSGVLLWREPPAGTATAPAISTGGIVAHSSAQKFIVAGSWVDIYGDNFTDVTTDWSKADFSNGLPTTLGGVQVLMNNQPCAIYYVSQKLVIVQAPNNLATTSSSVTTNVQVIHNGAPGNVVTVAAIAHEPSIFTYPGGSNVYPATLLSDGMTLGDPAVTPATRKAHPGENVTVWVTGLGDSPAGVLINSPLAYSGAVTIPGLADASGNVVTASFAGLIAPGLFQVNFTVPTNITSSRNIQVQVNGGGSQTVILPIGN